ncbi:hypothetical protein G6O67_008573 [Ophiocordyceps sinensis]|uniref:Uncharacterized protein n=1 Tax=Ophiocordyceps sinensis TaxID=72228 RepID=A0A8H4LRG1_9HYPO|nr:hypothetical protein G6O67_008573 [Ophiocordyceps sinensis]
MASTEVAVATFPVEVIAAMSDAELRQSIKEHRRPEGGYELPGDGWEQLSKDERNHLAERLKLTISYFAADRGGRNNSDQYAAADADAAGLIIPSPAEEQLEPMHSSTSAGRALTRKGGVDDT